MPIPAGNYRGKVGRVLEGLDGATIQGCIQRGVLGSVGGGFSFSTAISAGASIGGAVLSSGETTGVSEIDAILKAGISQISGSTSSGGGSQTAPTTQRSQQVVQQQQQIPQPQVNIVMQQPAQQQKLFTAPPAKDNTNTYVGIGLAAFGAIVLFVLLRDRKR